MGQERRYKVLVLKGKNLMTKRITLFLGHYGSGKTNVAVNYAVKLKEDGKNVSIYDLDIVNPYFRTVDAMKLLDEKGIELVVSPFAETNVDIPAMSAKSYQMVDNLDRYAVVDIGGDDRGALALGRFTDKIQEENNYELVLVINKYRPETRDLQGVLEIKEEIENTCKVKFTAIVNNSNLGKETTAETVLNSIPYAEEVSKALSLPILFTSVEERLKDELDKKIKNLLPMQLIKYGDWL